MATSSATPNGKISGWPLEVPGPASFFNLTGFFYFTHAKITVMTPQIFKAVFIISMLITRITHSGCKKNSIAG